MKNLAILAFLFAFAIPGAQADEGKDAAVKLVKDVIAMVKKEGKDAAIAAVNKGQFTKGELYPLVYDMEGKCLAHGTKPARVGQNMINDKDPDGKLFIKDRIDIAKGGSGWQKYRFQNPSTKKIENKEVYIENADGTIYAAGAYGK